MNKTLLSLVLVAAFAGNAGAQCTIRNGHLSVAFDASMHTQVSADYPGATPLTTGFVNSEWLETKYFHTDAFRISRIDSTSEAGLRRYTLAGRDETTGLEKIVTVTGRDAFPDVAYFRVAWVNHGNRVLPLLRWGNNRQALRPDRDSANFWSFQGSSHADRRDWIRPVRAGFSERNFMGMNASDYGGGIPLTDLWRRDDGLAVGVSEPVGRLVSLPVDFDRYANAATVGTEYDFPERTDLAPGDTLHTFETFTGVHTRDCFAMLRTFGRYMDAVRGVHPPATEPAAFEPVWCAWGYERDFTLKEILATLPKVKALGFRWVGLDDGFQQAEGDWHTNREHFPGGDAQMKAFVDSIHAQGMKAVLWWAPLAADPGSAFLTKHKTSALQQKDGSPEFITWWDAYYMAPTDTAVLRETGATVKLFLQDWGFDALKLDGQHMNACAPDYGDHGLDYPAQSYERMPQAFRVIFETARAIKPSAVVEFCPCGDVADFYHMPYTNQFVASDPSSSWQVRSKGKVLRAVMPGTAYFGDHVELTDNKADFASQVGIGAVPGTKFVWPATGVASKDENLLTPEKEILWRKWLGLYAEKQLATGVYRGDWYDIGYDFPEAHAIQKNGATYYAFYCPDFSGELTLRGLDPKKKYAVLDYVNGKKMGTVTGNNPRLRADFKGSLLLEVK